MSDFGWACNECGSAVSHVNSCKWLLQPLYTVQEMEEVVTNLKTRIAVLEQVGHQAGEVIGECLFDPDFGHSDSKRAQDIYHKLCNVLRRAA